MKDLIIIGILLAIVGLAAWYVIRAKRHHRCVGCPHCNSCNKHCQPK